MKKKIEIVAAVFQKDGRILATQRGYGNYKDWWEFPGGKIEPGETHEEALEREIREELDTKIRVGEHLITVDYEYPEFFLTMHCYWCTVLEGKLTLLEHEAAKWLPADDLWQVKWLPADKEVLECIERIFREDEKIDNTK